MILRLFIKESYDKKLNHPGYKFLKMVIYRSIEPEESFPAVKKNGFKSEKL